ncbi:hypothetical protein HYO05_08685 [Vibrio parahaemolyticus]|uniref:hypothetical protein n=1 Tax=Vibrio parahaemolyticus TaxID=670 RepID=UPI0004DED943|nr:hypothetical protein [Vibrio parahaemolyticus]MBE3700104.1 hypothetical protein [Vibrio parahaemolyticus]MBE3779849.1 hypothetical protein [Vibrio parahaemolyticus]MBM5034644.1 hypothetical protein [Vibrio parahaemolyticus]MBM5047860.1 hypothetical protein [Vibrio parahaemolyticus]MBM5076157.1 hypothetical protein [Vibrio parahaemolyticus]
MGEIYVEDGCKRVEFEDGRRKSIKRKDINELRAYLTKKKVKDGNDDKYLRTLKEYLEDFLKAKGDDKEDMLKALVEYLIAGQDNQDFYDKFRDNLRKKKKRAQKKKVQTRKLNVEEEVNEAGNRAHRLFP